MLRIEISQQTAVSIIYLIKQTNSCLIIFSIKFCWHNYWLRRSIYKEISGFLCFSCSFLHGYIYVLFVQVLPEDSRNMCNLNRSLLYLWYLVFMFKTNWQQFVWIKLTARKEVSLENGFLFFLCPRHDSVTTSSLFSIVILTFWNRIKSIFRQTVCLPN